MVTCCGLDEVYSSTVTQEASPIQDIYIGEWISRERGRLRAQGVGKCEVDFEWGRVEKDQRVYGHAAADICARTESE